jgi:hypothetical protein
VEFTAVLKTLKGMTAVIIISFTASLGRSRNMEVKMKFRGTINTIIVQDPKNNPIKAPLNVGFLLYTTPATNTMDPVAAKCIKAPIQELPALTVRACTITMTAVTKSPDDGPYRKEATRAGTSPGSYSRKDAVGMTGNLTKNIKTNPKEESMANLTIRSVVYLNVPSPFLRLVKFVIQ